VSPIGASKLEPGARGLARIQLEGAPVHLLPGDRFILRGFARSLEGGSTLGGGTVLDAAPRRLRRGDPELVRALDTFSKRNPETEVLVRVARRELAGASRAELAHETGLSAATLMRRSLGSRRGDTPPRAASAGSARARSPSSRPACCRSLRITRPSLCGSGMPRGALRGRLPAHVAPSASDLVLARLAAAGRIALEGDLVRRSEHRPRVAPADAAILEKLRGTLHAAGLEPPGLRELAERAGVTAEKLRPLLVHLERAGEVVRAPGDIWFERAPVDALRGKLVAHLRAHGAIDTPAYKALIGTSRRTAVPLMELFDEERLTLRSGEKRVLRSAS
jgi:selenocysteine-specific elongation factor